MDSPSKRTVIEGFQEARAARIQVWGDDLILLLVFLFFFAVLNAIFVDNFLSNTYL